MIVLRILASYFTNPCIIIPFLASLTAQCLKYITRAILEHNYTFRDFFRDGGMPSSHTATVIALVVTVAWASGIASVEFAVASVFASIVMRDAVGIRREAGKQAVTIKELTDAFNKAAATGNEIESANALKEIVGHTVPQLIGGVIWGIIAAVVGMLIAGVPFAMV